MLRKWKEVYNTSELEKFLAAKNLLDEQKIKYKTDMVNNNLRMVMNSPGGRSGNVKDFYKISVEGKDEANVRVLLSKIGR